MSIYPVYGAPEQPAIRRHETGKPGSTPTPKAKTKTFRVGPQAPTKEEAGDWLAHQTPYPNLVAEDTERARQIAESARSFCEQQMIMYVERMHEIHERWRVLDHMLKGNSLSRMFPDSIIHVPELYKAVETIVPRLCEPVREYDPCFNVEGRDRQDDKRAKKLLEWLRYQMDLNKVTTHHVEEWARILVIYSFVAVKTTWDVRYQKRNVRTVTTTEKNGEIEYTIKTEEKEVQVYEGAKYDAVNPYRFFVDPDCTDVQKGLYVGDSREMDEQELIEQWELGRFANVDRLLQEEPRSTGGLSTEYRRQSQHLELYNSSMMRRRAEGEPKRYEVVEMWCKWRPTPDDEIDEYVLTVANGSQVLRVQRNPYDNKHRPYAVARASKEPFSFANVGMLDHGVRLNIELDEHRMLALKGHGMSLCPVTFVGSDFDGPPSLFDVEPGRVFQTNQPMQFIQSPSTIGQMQGMEETLRRDIDETIGSPRYFQGGGRSDTATEIERKVKEGNRRLRRVIFSFSDMFVQMLEQTTWLSAQYVSARKKFRVLGKMGGNMGFDMDIAPEDFADPVDIKITGLRGVENQGLRGTQITTLITQLAPFLPQLMQDGMLNLPALVSEVARSVLGHPLDDRIIQVPKGMDEMASPTEENMMLMQGQEIEVHPDDDDERHFQDHKAQLVRAMYEGASGADLAMLLKHMGDHAMAQEQKRMRRRAKENPPAGPFRGGEMADQSAQTQDGRYGRSPDLFGAQPNQTPPGETPGPARPASTAAPDRQPAIPQPENRP